MWVRCESYAVPDILSALVSGLPSAELGDYGASDRIVENRLLEPPQEEIIDASVRTPLGGWRTGAGVENNIVTGFQALRGEPECWSGRRCNRPLCRHEEAQNNDLERSVRVSLRSEMFRSLLAHTTVSNGYKI